MGRTRTNSWNVVSIIRITGCKIIFPLPLRLHIPPFPVMVNTFPQILTWTNSWINWATFSLILTPMNLGNSLIRQPSPTASSGSPPPTLTLQAAHPLLHLYFPHLKRQSPRDTTLIPNIAHRDVLSFLTLDRLSGDTSNQSMRRFPIPVPFAPKFSPPLILCLVIEFVPTANMPLRKLRFLLRPLPNLPLTTCLYPPPLLLSEPTLSYLFRMHPNLSKSNFKYKILKCLNIRFKVLRHCNKSTSNLLFCFIGPLVSSG